MSVETEVVVGDEVAKLEGDMGRFELMDRLGQGSMGGVWRGRHREQAWEVAVKVMSSERADDPRLRSAFRREVRSIAELNHPMVIDVLEYGELEREVSSGQDVLRAGSPFLVMELAPLGTLEERLGRQWKWPELRWLLLSILDGLAHSHARGVLHRDIKPSNILFGEPGERDNGVRLSDFGLALALRRGLGEEGQSGVVGTPRYMAPEQILGDWRKYGPWTDIYAVGCLAYELASGRVAARGSSVKEVAERHLQGDMAPLDVNGELPPAFKAWVGAMMTREPMGRFESAADAAYALLGIEDRTPGWIKRDRWTKKVLQLPGEGGDESAEMGNGLHALSPLEEQARKISFVDLVIDDRAKRRGMPRRWKLPQGQRKPQRLVGTGEGLMGIKRLSLVGRKEEREELWSLCHGAQTPGGARVGWVEGPAGIGKDFLLQWVCDRLCEVGVRHVFRVRAIREEGARDPLAQMVERFFRLEDAPRREVAVQMEELLRTKGATNDYEWRAITELLRPSTGDDGHGVRFQSRKQRAMAYIGFLERLSGPEPVVVWVRDLQWSPELQRWIKAFQEAVAKRAIPVVVLVSRGDGPGGEEAEDRERLEALAAAESTAVLELDRLSDQEMRKILEDVLFLEVNTSTEIIRRANGSPQVALEIVKFWSSVGLLEPSPYGYCLSDGEPEPRGDIPSEIWNSVAERLIQSDEARREALEIGAVLGSSLTRSVWRRATKELEGFDLDEFVDEMVRRRYLEEKTEGLKFRQPWLREVLYEGAQQRGAWTEVCRSAAESLARAGQPAVREQRGLLMLEAGELEGALAFLEPMISDCVERREYHRTIYLGQKVLSALDECGDEEVGESVEEAVGPILIALITAWNWTRQMDRSQKLVKRLEELGTRHDRPLWLGLAAKEQVNIELVQGNLEKAHELGQEAMKYLAQTQEGRSHRASVWGQMANVAVERGHLEKAKEYIERAQNVPPGLHNVVDARYLAWSEFKIRHMCGEEVGLEEVEREIELSLRQGVFLGAAFLLMAQGDMLRHRGRLDEASRCYEQAGGHFQNVDQDRLILVRVNRGLTAIQSGHFRQGGQLGDQVLVDALREERPRMELYARALRLPGLMVDESWKEVDREMNRIEELCERLGTRPDKDMCLILEKAQEVQRAADRGSSLLRRLEELASGFSPETRS